MFITDPKPIDYTKRLPTTDIQTVARLVVDHGSPIDQRIAALPVIMESQLDKEEKAALINVLLLDTRRALRFWAVLHAPSMGDTHTIGILDEIFHKSDDEDLQRIALGSWAELAGASSLPRLLGFIYDEKCVWQEVSMFVVSRVPGSQTVQALQHILKTHPTSVYRFDAALRLATLGLSDGKEILEGRLPTGREQYALPVVIALANLGVLSALTQLDALLADPDSLSPVERLTLYGRLLPILNVQLESVNDVFAPAREWVRDRLHERRAEG